MGVKLVTNSVDMARHIDCVVCGCNQPFVDERVYSIKLMQLYSHTQPHSLDLKRGRDCRTWIAARSFIFFGATAEYCIVFNTSISPS